MADSAYQQLIQKLDAFIRKYYKNQVIRGVIYTVGALAIFFLLTNFVEYFGHLGKLGRAILFYGYLFVAFGILANFIVFPLVKLYRLGKVLSYEAASEIIGRHFSEVRDKLINTLQLNQQLVSNPSQQVLIAASIDQKIKEIRPISFETAVDLKENYKYLRFAYVPLLVIGVIWLVYPSFINESSKRIISYNNAFEPLAPFTFNIQNNSLKTPTQKDFELMVKIGGEEIPKELFIDIDGNKFKLKNEDKFVFKHTFKNVQRNIKFRLYADGFYSKEYVLNALPNPILVNFKIKLEYPVYTGKKNETISNSGDLVIPAGTKVNWEFNTKNTDKVQLKFSDEEPFLNQSEEGIFIYSSKITKDKKYKVFTSNQFLRPEDQIEYTISVVADEYPAISVEEKQDSIQSAVVFYKGEIEDDYGFEKLKFNYKQTNDSKVITEKSIDVPFNKNFVKNFFFWNWNFSDLNLNPGDEVTYFFEIWDNDRVNGSKSTKTQKKIFKVPSSEEIEQKRENNNEDIKANLKESIKDANQLQKELNELNRRILEKKDISWQDKKKVKDLLEKQDALEKQIEEIKKDNQLNNQQNEEFKKSNEKILEKQQALEKLFEQILSDEMKEKLKELEKLMENLDKNKMKDMIDQMKLDNKDVEKELDRSLELFKQLEFDQKLNASIEKLDKLKEKQEELSKKSEEKNANEQDLKSKQDQLNKEFEELRKDINDLEKKNSELEEPQKMESTDPLEENIEKEMQNSSQELNKGKGQKASKSQKNASEKMKEMSDKMKAMQAEMEGESLEEDIGKLREILENLLQLSFDQERLMKELYKTNPVSPRYVEITAEQKNISDDAKMIEDSLFALSKRVAELQSFINREISSINMNLDKTIEFLAERQTQSAASKQQYVMTSINNLTLMLSEISEQMQRQMAQQQQQKEGGGSCKKPGKNKKPGGQKPSMGTMRKMQEQLNEQLKQMKEGMGKSKGEKGKQGETGKQGSEQLAKMAAQQEMLRNELQKMMNEMMKEGDGNSGNLRNIANKMEQTESDIVNKNISLETLRRQQEILTRLLEAENAERERELDTKRESNENKLLQNRNISVFSQYTKSIQQETELLKTISPSLKPFYKNMVKAYFNTIN
jgi:hypothetical protein